MVSITSAGHLVSWQYKGIVLTEVAASAQHPLPQKRRVMVENTWRSGRFRLGLPQYALATQGAR
jgi:hypothetical protein